MQNTVSVRRVEVLSPELVEQQLIAVLEDIPPQAAKLGALGSRQVIETISRLAGRWSFPLVLDPVMISKHGAALLPLDGQAALRELLLPHATLVTPNLPEAAALTGESISNLAGMRRAARKLVEAGARAALVKGGHLAGDAIDILLIDNRLEELPATRIDTPHTHGTGCVYAAAIAACLARGLGLRDSVLAAKQFVTEAIRTNPGLGHGSGPLNLHARIPSISEL